MQYDERQATKTVQLVTYDGGDTWQPALGGERQSLVARAQPYDRPFARDSADRLRVATTSDSTMTISGTVLMQATPVTQALWYANTSGIAMDQREMQQLQSRVYFAQIRQRWSVT